MTFIDLSHDLTKNTKPYPDDPEIIFSEIFCHDKNDFSLHNISLGTHIATHIDSPYHFFKDGRKIIDYDIDSLHGTATILDAEHIIKKDEKKIDSNILYELAKSDECDFKNEILIIKTSWWKKAFEDDYFFKNPYLSDDFADKTIELGFKLIALDFPSVDKFSEFKIHRKLLGNNVLIAENLKNTDKLTKKNYESFFIPLKIETEASPIRAFVKEI